MALTVVLTGFGAFPGAPFNPTESLVRELARRRPALTGVRRVAHVFSTAYAAVDDELPALLAREQPDALIMFGLASRSRHLRIETRARNVLSALVPDATGHRASEPMIDAKAPQTQALRAPSQKLALAVRGLGLSATVSRDAGTYLCNYLCWRASESACKAGGPRLVTFVHVPLVRDPRLVRPPGAKGRKRPIEFADLKRAGEAILLAAVAELRAAR